GHCCTVRWRTRFSNWLKQRGSCVRGANPARRSVHLLHGLERRATGEMGRDADRAETGSTGNDHRRAEIRPLTGSSRNRREIATRRRRREACADRASNLRRRRADHARATLYRAARKYRRGYFGGGARGGDDGKGAREHARSSATVGQPCVKIGSVKGDG